MDESVSYSLTMLNRVFQVLLLPAAMLLLFDPAASVEAGREDPTGLRVLTYNLLHDGPLSGFFENGTHLEERLDMTIQELRRLQPDVIALQEASDSRRHGNVAQRIADALGYQMVFAPATERIFGLRSLDRLIISVLGFKEGPAILSRYPIIASEVYDLPRCRHRLDPRILLRAEIDTPDGPVQVFSAHTSKGDECQLQRVGELFREHRGHGRAVLMGDLAEVIRERLKQHKTKEFWVSAIVFVSKDDNLTKAHVRYIEGRLLTEAIQVGRCTLEQNQAGGAKLPESDRVDYGRLPFVCSPTFASSRLRSSDSNCTTVRQAATRRNLFLPHEGCGGARSPHAGWLCRTSRFYCRHGATQLCEKVSVSAYTP